MPASKTLGLEQAGLASKPCTTTGDLELSKSSVVVSESGDPLGNSRKQGASTVLDSIATAGKPILRAYERRVEELQRIQMDFVCKELSAFRQQFATVQADICTLQRALEQEHAARASAEAAFSREVETRFRDLANVSEVAIGGSRKHLEANVSALQGALEQEQVVRESTAAALSKQMETRLGQLASGGSSKPLEAELSALHRALEQEQAARALAEEALRRDMDSRLSELTTGAWNKHLEAQAAALADLTEGLADVRARLCGQPTSPARMVRGLVDEERAARTTELDFLARKNEVTECVVSQLQENVSTISGAQANALAELSAEVAQVRSKISGQPASGDSPTRVARGLVDEERAARTTEVDFLSQKHEVIENVLSKLQEIVIAEQSSRAQLRIEVQTWLGFESKTREEADLALEEAMQDVKATLAEVLKTTSQVVRREDTDKATSTASADIEMLKHGLAKVVEVARNEHSQLRKECSEAIQRAAVNPDGWRGRVTPMSVSPQGKLTPQTVSPQQTPPSSRNGSYAIHRV